jgi:hypothetical protein
MTKANLNDRRTVEEAYPREAFERDVGLNSAPKAIAHHGLRIQSEPDGEGWFTVSRGSRHVGEADEVIHSVFVVPTRSYDNALAPGAGSYGGTQEREDGVAAEAASAASAYDGFIDQVIEAARSTRFQKLAPGDERLKGFHGG